MARRLSAHEMPAWRSRSSSVSSHDSPYESINVQQGLLQSPTASHDNLASRRSRRTVTRYLCFAVLATLLLFIGFLVRASFVSRRRLELGQVERPPPAPPDWTVFPFLDRYFGGLQTLVSAKDNKVEYPNPGIDNLNGSIAQPLPPPRLLASFPKSQRFELNQTNDVVECFLDQQNTIRVPQLRFYDGVPDGMPAAAVGSGSVIGVRDDICFDRFARFAPYGYGYSRADGGLGIGLHDERQGADAVFEDVPRIDFRKVRWADAQRQCYDRNKHRFPARASNSLHVRSPSLTGSLSTTPHTQESPSTDMSQSTSTASSLQQQSTPVFPTQTSIVSSSPQESTASSSPQTPTANSSPQLNDTSPNDTKPSVKRSAIVLRTWSTRLYNSADLLNLRALVAETALRSGGQYDVHFLVQYKPNNVPFWDQPDLATEILNTALPDEFRGMGFLWSEELMNREYPDLNDTFYRDMPIYGAYRGLLMPVQYFAHQHPEYDFVWNWELDVRWIGHWLDFFESAGLWARQQPRKGLWERNERYYVPGSHGSWEDFSQMARVQSSSPDFYPLSSHSEPDPRPIWGPQKPIDILRDAHDPTPPHPIEQDNHNWGVGEDADYISTGPLFETAGTRWFYSDDVIGYDLSKGIPPRRAVMGASARLSRRLLDMMHRETKEAKHHMHGEMWPAALAFQHGYKAAYLPHPVYLDRRWPSNFLAQTLNRGKNGASGGGPACIPGGNEGAMIGHTFFYQTKFAPNLWKRWLGLVVNNDGGAEWEKANQGRMCLPPVLFHPIKSIDLESDEGPDAEPGSLD